MVYRKSESKPKEVYGIMGNKGHGKDTFANILVSSNKGASFTIIHFADALKDLVVNVFGITRYDVETQEGKEAKFAVPINIDLFLPAIKAKTGLSIKPQGLIAASPRELLQFVGSNYIRTVDQSYWVGKIKSILNTKKRIVIPDTRFTNEAAVITASGGKIIRITRVDIPKNTDLHISEQEGLSIDPDLELGIRTGDLSLMKRVANLIALGKWESAMRYDYRRVQNAIQLYQSGATLEKCVNAIGVKNNDSQAFRCILEYYGIPQRKPGAVSNPHRFENGEEQKQCNTCHEWKNISEFNTNNNTWDLLHCLCKKCASNYHKQKYKDYEKEVTFKSLFNQTKRGAEYRMLEFDLTETDIKELWEKQEGKCHYTNQPMTWSKNKPDKISIDRINSSAGYTKNNVVLCWSRVNLMKGQLDIEEFKKIIRLLNQNIN